MTTSKQVQSRTLTQSDLELVERIIYKTADDIAVSISRSFERLEERMDAMEERLYRRIAELEVHLEDICTDGQKVRETSAAH